jgi:sec-independent protein translocase protein TatB
MFDIGWSEIMVIAAVAIIVVGPKDLPRMLRTFGKTMGQVRRTANDFKRQFDDALREAEREAGLEETRKQIKAAVEPVTNVKKDLEKTVSDASKPAASSKPGASADRLQEAEPLKTGTAPAHAPEAASDRLQPAEPVKTGATAAPAQGTDAA